MEPLAAFRDQLLVVSGLASKEAFPKAGDPTGEHIGATTTFLTGVRPRQIGGKSGRIIRQPFKWWPFDPLPFTSNWRHSWPGAVIDLSL